MTKNSFHFKIAAWSCRNPGLFYLGCIAAFFLVGMLFFVVLGLFSTPAPVAQLNETRSDQSELQTGLADLKNWTPVKDMDLPDGTRCRIYKKEGTSITNCYKMLNGEWVFYQSF